jgi:hypothetical protein
MNKYPTFVNASDFINKMEMDCDSLKTYLVVWNTMLHACFQPSPILLNHSSVYKVMWDLKNLYKLWNFQSINHLSPLSYKMENCDNLHKIFFLSIVTPCMT